MKIRMRQQRPTLVSKYLFTSLFALLFASITLQAQSGKILNRKDGVQFKNAQPAAATDQLVTVSPGDNKVKVAGTITVADVEGAVDKTIASFAVSNDNGDGSVKRITFTYADGSTQSATFNDNSEVSGAGSDGVVNGANFTTTSGDLAITRSVGGDITVSLDGRYALTIHTHQINDIVGLQGEINGKATTAQGTRADEAHSWGDHALEGYSTGAHTVDTNTQLSEAEVDAFTNNNGYLSTEVDPTVAAHIKTISPTDIAEWNEAYAKSEVSVAVTGDATKTITLTRQDGSTITGTFVDNNTQRANDGVINFIEFDPSDGILSVSSTLDNQFTASIDGRYSLLSHTHTASDITDFDTEVANNTAVAANTAKVSNATHTGDVVGSTSLIIGDGRVTSAKIGNGAVNNAKLSNMAANTIKGRSGMSGDPEDLTATQVREVIGFDPSDYATSAQGDLADNSVQRTGNDIISGTKTFTGITVLSNRTDQNSLKLGRLDGLTFASGSRFLSIYNVGLNGFNSVVIGGGTNSEKAATRVIIQTNDDPEANGSTERFSINGTVADFQVPINVNGDITGDNIESVSFKSTSGNTSIISNTASVVMRNNNTTDNFHRPVTKDRFKVWLGGTIATGSFNNIVESGHYRVDNTVGGAPLSNTFWGLTVSGNAVNAISQVAVNVFTGNTYVRAFSSSWSPWKRLDNDFAPDTPWVNLTLTAGLTGQIEYKRKNGKIIIIGTAINNTGNTIDTIGVLPLAYRLTRERRFIALLNNSKIYTEGSVFSGEILVTIPPNESAIIDREFTQDTTD